MGRKFDVIIERDAKGNTVTFVYEHISRDRKRHP